MTPYIQFSVNRNASGDFRNIAVSERAKLIAKEWKALSEGEKKVSLTNSNALLGGTMANQILNQKYKDIFTADHDRYSEEYTSVYGHTPPSINGGQQQAAAAAA